MKRIENMTGLFAHLITCNEQNKTFNEIWDYYFSNLPVGFMTYEEVLTWLNEEIDDTSNISKATAIKPDLIADGYSNGELVYDFWECPRCGKAYEVEYEHYDFCPNCGQKIDWISEVIK